MKRKRYNFFIDEWLHEKAKKIAVKKGRSLSCLIRELLRELIKKEGK